MRRRQNYENFAQLAANSPYIRSAGIECLSEGDGKALLRLPAKEEQLNSIGIIHGGVISALADTACGIALLSLAPRGSRFVTASLNVNYVGTPKEGALFASAKVTTLKKRMAFAECVIHDSAEEVVARGTVVFSVSPPSE